MLLTGHQNDKKLSVDTQETLEEPDRCFGVAHVIQHLYNNKFADDGTVSQLNTSGVFGSEASPQQHPPVSCE